MKYFLAVILFCTGNMRALAAEDAPRAGWILGSVQAWSAWSPIDVETDPASICQAVKEAYNALNASFGYWGRLAKAEPVRQQARELANGIKEKRFFCQIQVLKFFTPADENAGEVRGQNQ